MNRTLHPFPARMAPDIAVDFLPPAGSPALEVLDPMCGSGTVLGVASARGHRARGVDIDPLAVLMSEVATAPIDIEEFESAVKSVVSVASSSRSVALPWSLRDRETRAFAEYWFGKSQRVGLARLASAIDEIDDISVKQGLQIALSRLVVTKTPKASLASDTSHSRPHRTTQTSEFDVIAGFARSTVEVTRFLNGRTIAGDVSVSLGDSRNLSQVGDASVDLTISSPPYLNAIDYMRGHKLSLIWLGYSIEDLRAIRSTSIGAERAPDGSADVKAEEMLASVAESAADSSRLPMRTLTRYALDLCAFSKELGRVSKSGAIAVLVVGNSTLKGNYIENDRLARIAMEDSGFTLSAHTRRELPENRRYMPVNSSGTSDSMSKRMRSESVLVFARE